MATAQKKNKFITPPCVAKYPWLMVPDTKFNALGEYRVDLIMTPEQAKALFAKVKEEAEQQAAKIRHNSKAAQGWKTAWPFKNEQDDDGNETGNKVAVFKQKARIVRDGQEDINFHVVCVDAKRNPIPREIKLGSGTVMSVCFTVRAVEDNLNKVVRIMFHPIAAQIITLVEWSQDFGFEEAEGYVAPETPAGTRLASPGLEPYAGEAGELPAEVPSSHAPTVQRKVVPSAVGTVDPDAPSDDDIPF